MLVFSDLEPIVMKSQVSNVTMVRGALRRYLREGGTEPDEEVDTEWFERFINWMLGTYHLCSENIIRTRLARIFNPYIFIIQSEPLPTAAEIEANPALLFKQS